MYFASNSSVVAKEAIAGKLEVSELSRTIAVVTETGEVLTRSDALMYITARLDWPYRLIGLCRVVPRVVRDCAYSLFARLRYRLFGTVSECALIEPELRGRFL